MSQALVIHAHPAPHQSRVNRRLADAARSMPGVDVHDLYESYPDFYIDVAREQARVEQASLLVFLHPIQWYSAPALLKEWIDSVFETGWAHGPGGNALRGKGYWLAVTTGAPAEAYAHGGVHGRPFGDFLAPFEQTAALCGMQWLAPHVLHGAHLAGMDAVEAHVAAFTRRLARYLPDLPKQPENTDDGT
ncbi:MAG: glutathione-regulated potassium-efflux system oxidoreductase KefF [Telluria sp.]